MKKFAKMEKEANLNTDIVNEAFIKRLKDLKNKNIDNSKSTASSRKTLSLPWNENYQIEVGLRDKDNDLLTENYWSAGSDEDDPAIANIHGKGSLFNPWKDKKYSMILNQIAVKNKHRGKGVATDFFNTVENVGKDIGAEKLLLNPTDTGNSVWIKPKFGLNISAENKRELFREYSKYRKKHKDAPVLNKEMLVSKYPIEFMSNFLKKREFLTELDKPLNKIAKMKEDIKYNPYQKRVLDNPSDSMIVAHAVGSGKTLTGIAKFEKMRTEGKAKKALVVVPAGLRDNFGVQGVKKFTDSKYNIVGNKQEQSSKQYKALDPNSDYNIVSYEMFRQNPEKYIKDSGADTVIADEMHRLRNEGLSTVESFKKTRPMYKNFIGLTGSLINNSPTEVQPLVELASGGSGVLGPNKKGFEKLFIKRNEKGPYKKLATNRKPITGFRHEKVLSKELSKYIDYADNEDMKDISKIPTKKINMVDVPITNEQLKIYRGILDKNPAIAKLITKKRLETLKDDEIAKAYNGLIEARKLMNSTGSVVPGMDLTTSAKITPKAKRILDDLETHLKSTPDGQAILLSNLIHGGADVLEAGLKERGIPFGEFIGKGNEGITETSRQQAVKDYNAAKKRVMVISGAGAEGLSLGDTTWEGTFDPHYNPERIKQMEARGIRAFGQSKRAPEDRIVNVSRYKSTVPKFLGIFKKYPYKTPDEVIYEIANNKDTQNQMLYKLLKGSQPKPKGVGEYEQFKDIKSNGKISI